MENYTDAHLWLYEETTRAQPIEFDGSNDYFYKISLPGGGIITPHLSVLESIRDACDKLIASARERRGAAPAQSEGAA
jgi:uncharacterized lipoprotein YbaY